MIPVLHGVWASGGLAGDFEHIETQTVGAGGAASVTFSSIPGTYKHLQIRSVARDTYAATGNLSLRFRINGDTSSSYVVHRLYGTGTTATSDYQAANTYAYAFVAAGGSNNASIFAVTIMDILDYASTTKNKTMRCLMGGDYNGSGSVNLQSALFTKTDAITSVSILSDAANIAQYSTFSLYGVK